MKHMLPRPCSHICTIIYAARCRMCLFRQQLTYMHACRLIVVPVNKKTLQLTPSNVLSRVTARTAVVVASAPSYPHGIIDDIAGIANVAARCRICMHVDSCLGGFVLPFMRHLRYEVPQFDFSLPGVTSMSADTHKYGLAHKGTSVVLYRNKALRRAQFTPVTEWSGGFYVSPGLSGSRCFLSPFSCAFPFISLNSV
jgi:sphinganine-1-phosphate aldolase